MKNIGLGIGLLLFAILFQLCSIGMDLVSLAIGIIGIIVVFRGAIRNS